MQEYQAVSAGTFAQHQDGMSLTVLSLLDDTGFEGGGTQFWLEQVAISATAHHLHRTELYLCNGRPVRTSHIHDLNHPNIVLFFL